MTGGGDMDEFQSFGRYEMEEVHLRQLRSSLLDLRQPALQELIRFFDSGRFVFLSEENLRDVGNYRAIEVDGEVFFQRAFSSGKEVEAILRVAWNLGPKIVRNKLYEFANDLREFFAMNKEHNM